MASKAPKSTEVPQQIIPEETTVVPENNFIYLCVRKPNPWLFSNWYVLEPDCIGTSIPSLEKQMYLADCESEDSKFKLDFSLPNCPEFPYDYGCVAVESDLYIIGGLEYKSGTPSKRVFKFEYITNSWYEIEPMLTPRVNPTVVLYKKQRIFVFGSATLDDVYKKNCNENPEFRKLTPWAEHMHIEYPFEWYPIDDVPDNLLLNGHGNAEIYGHTVIDSVIVLWTQARFFLFNPEATDTIARWRSFSISHLCLDPGLDILSTKVTVMDGIFYWWCDNSIYAYDLVGNVAFSDCLFTIDAKAGREFHICPTPYTQQFIFSSATNELCLIWNHSNKDDKLMIVCGKVRLLKSVSPKGRICLSVLGSDFEYFCLDGTYISYCVGMAKDRPDGNPPVIDLVSVLEKLSLTMYMQTIKEPNSHCAVDEKNFLAQVSISESEDFNSAPSEDSEEDTCDTHPKKPEKEGSSTFEYLKLGDLDLPKVRNLKKYQHTLDAHLKKHEMDGLSTLGCLKLEDLKIPMAMKKAIIAKLKKRNATIKLS